ncbi:MAG: hypothetical protein CME24_03565 [Gemmatimonadetes bacterium]|nr:hypothetical protein [Gemmatimonadota bacterium]
MSNTIDIGNGKQLFLDDRWFADQRGMTLSVNPPIKDQIVLAPGKKWDELAVYAYGTVLEHDGKFKMWYDGVSRLDNELPQYRNICYAESDDGIHWERPNVGRYEWEGIRLNNIVLPGCNGGIMVDPNGPDEHRFKGLILVKENSVWPGSKGAICGLHGGRWRLELYLCTSPDGYNWTRHPTPVSDYFHDTQNQLFYDTRLGKYAAYFRTHSRGRTVGRLEVDDPMDLPWIPLDGEDPEAVFPTGKKHLFQLALTADESDPADADLYTACVHQYPWADDAYFSFTTPYRHYPVGDTSDTTLTGKDPRGRHNNDGPVDIQLAVSRDGIAWTRPDRRPYVGLGLAGEYDGGQSYMGLGMIRMGNEVWMYDSPTKRTHGVPPGQPEAGLRLLRQRLDGFISADAAYEGAEFTTPMLTFSGSELQLNVDCSALGQVWVEIRNEDNHVIDGYSLDESIDIDRNHIAAPVRWHEKDDVGELIGRPVRLHFKLRACKLYAFQFVDGEEG